MRHPAAGFRTKLCAGVIAAFGAASAAQPHEGIAPEAAPSETAMWKLS